MKNEDYESLYKELFHEVRSITSRMINHAGELSRSLDKKPDFPRAVFETQAVAELTFQLQNWLQLSEIQSGSAVYDPALKVSKSLHGVFFRAGKMMQASMRERRLRWSIQTDANAKDTYALEGYPILDTLPYLLLDNAIKYSAAETSIKCYIGRVSGHIFVRVRSRGPLLEEDEIERVTESGFRGENGRMMCSEGGGRGLALAEMICRLHEATLGVECKSEGYAVNGVDFGVFEVNITF